MPRDDEEPHPLADEVWRADDGGRRWHGRACGMGRRQQGQSSQGRGGLDEEAGQGSPRRRDADEEDRRRHGSGRQAVAGPPRHEQSRSQDGRGDDEAGGAGARDGGDDDQERRRDRQDAQGDGQGRSGRQVVSSVSWAARKAETRRGALHPARPTPTPRTIECFRSARPRGDAALPGLASSRSACLEPATSGPRPHRLWRRSTSARKPAGSPPRTTPRTTCP